MSSKFGIDDIVSFIDIEDRVRVGYITKHEGEVKIRVPHPEYYYKSIDDTTVLIKKEGWKVR